MKPLLTKWQRKLLVAPFLALVIAITGTGSLVVTSQPAHAQIVCVNCSNIIQQLIDYAKQIQQYATQLNQYQTQINQFQDQLLNSVKLESYFFDEAINTIRAVESIMQSGSNIVYSMSNLDNRFRQTFPDFQSVFQRHDTFDMIETYNRHAASSERAYDSALGALKALREHSESMDDEQELMDSTAGNLTSASGRLDAIQAAGTYAQINAQQLMRMRQVLMTQVDLMATKMAEEQALRDEDRAKIFQLMSKRPQDPRDLSIGDSYFPGGGP